MNFNRTNRIASKVVSREIGVNFRSFLDRGFLLNLVGRFCLATVFLFSATLGAFGQEPTVLLDVVMRKDFDRTQGHEWAKMLAEVGASNVKVRELKPTDEVGIVDIGENGKSVIRVTGWLTNKGTLEFPNATFRISDQKKIAEWIKQLKMDGPKGVTEEKQAFGLIADELVDLHEALSIPFPSATKGERPEELLTKITRIVKVPIEIPSSALDACREGEPIFDEMEGLSCGTVLAGILRPQGLVAVPGKRAKDRKLAIQVVDSRKAEEFWPVGWPPTKVADDIAPQLFKKIKVEIRDAPLDAALKSVQAKLGLPFLFDQNGMAKEGIELAEEKVTFTGDAASYDKILDRLLGQIRPAMKYELRVDESDQPFLWISVR